MALREAILEAAVKAVDLGGEAALRVHDIARDVGCSVSALYVHYGSREGLAERALLEWYRRHVDSAADSLAQNLRRAKSLTAVKKALAVHLEEMCSREAQAVHLARAELVAAARTRPTVREALHEAERRRHADLRDALVAARAQGVVRSDLDVDAVATLLRSTSLSQAMAVSDGSGDGRSWTKVLGRALESVLLP